MSTLSRSNSYNSTHENEVDVTSGAGGGGSGAEDHPHFFSPKRKRMASLDTLNAHHYHLNQSDLTDVGNMSFQTASSSVGNTTVGLHTSGSATSSLVHDVSSGDHSRLYEQGSLHHASFGSDHESSFIPQSALTVTQFLSPRASLVKEPTSPVTSTARSASTTFRPAALFSGTEVGQSKKNKQRRRSGQSKLIRVRANIFYGDSENGSDNLDNSSGGWAVSGSVSSNEDVDDLDNNDDVDDEMQNRSNRDDDPNEHIDRLLSESDTSIDKALFPRQQHYLGKHSLNGNESSMTDHDITSISPFGVPEKSPLGHRNSLSHGFQTTVRRQSKITPVDGSDNHHIWLTENVSDFTRSCDLYATRVDRDRIDVPNNIDLGDVPASPLKHRRTNSFSHQVLFPSSPDPLILTDFGTPVTEAGSPAVLDGIDYEVGDDSLMDLSRDSTSSRFSTGSVDKQSHGHHQNSNGRLYTRSVLSSSCDDFEQYDLFARQIIAAGPDSVEKPATKVRRKSKAIDMDVGSPSGIHAVGDLSSTSLRFNDSYGNSAPSAFSQNLSMFSNGEHSDSQSHSKYIPRPLPDPAAFDHAVTTKVNQSFEHHLTSPVCPATPSRTPAWNSGAESDSEFLSLADPNGGVMPPMPAFMRQNSLACNKILLAQSESPHGDVEFHRDFVIEGVIGTGTFAEVYKVKSTAPDQGYFAVKKIKRQFRSRKDREWLLSEVRVMKKVNRIPCPYIIPFIRAWQEDNHFFVQLGLAEKGTLKDLANWLVGKKETFPTPSLWHVVHDVSLGLKHIHDCGIVHLDIKPANILINSRGQLQIGDFGMASVVGSQDDSHEGDTRYMAPELLNISERLPSADIFSLGLTIYELCFTLEQIERGNLLLPTEGPLWHKLREGESDPVLNRPTEMVQLIQNMLLPEPEDRPTAEMIANVLLVKNLSDDEDPTLLNAPGMDMPTRPTPIQRPNGFHPILRISSISDVEHQAYMQELLARAITPH